MSKEDTIDAPGVVPNDMDIFPSFFGRTRAPKSLIYAAAAFGLTLTVQAQTTQSIAFDITGNGAANGVTGSYSGSGPATVYSNSGATVQISGTVAIAAAAFSYSSLVNYSLTVPFTITGSNGTLSGRILTDAGLYFMGSFPPYQNFGEPYLGLEDVMIDSGTGAYQGWTGHFFQQNGVPGINHYVICASGAQLGVCPGNFTDTIQLRLAGTLGPTAPTQPAGTPLPSSIVLTLAGLGSLGIWTAARRRSIV